MLEPLCVRAFLFFSQVRQRRHPSARLHVQNISPWHAQRGASRKAFHGPRRVAVVWRSRRAHTELQRRSRVIQRREMCREQGRPRRARGPSAGPGAQAPRHDLTRHSTACKCYARWLQVRLSSTAKWLQVRLSSTAHSLTGPKLFLTVANPDLSSLESVF